jgi:signal transduction histidine kinase
LQSACNWTEQASSLIQKALVFSSHCPFETTDKMDTLLDYTAPLREVLELMQEIAPANIVLESRLHAMLPLSAGHTGLSRLLVMELLINAIEATSSNDGIITVETGVEKTSTCFDDFVGGQSLASGNYICFSVKDTGCGMDEETLANLFLPGFSTKAGHAGQGLAIVKDIVQTYQGAIDLKSHPGRGTTIKILFPIHEPYDKASLTAATAVSQQRPPKKQSLTMADDEINPAINS